MKKEKNYIVISSPKQTKIINVKNNKEYIFNNISKIIIDNFEMPKEQLLYSISNLYPNIEKNIIQNDIANILNQMNKLEIVPNNIQETFKVEEYVENSPKHALIEIINTCCFKCDHCYIPSSPNIIKIEDFKRIIDELLKLNCNEITLTGGEPFLHPDFIKLYLYAKSKGFLITINTNLFLLNKKILQVFKKYNPKLIEVSIYGFNNKSYENFTHRKNSYSIVKHNIELLTNNHISLNAKTVLTKKNYKYIYKIKDLAQKMKLSFRYDYIIFPKLDNTSSNPERLSPKEIVKVIIKDADTIKLLSSQVFNMKPNTSDKVFQCSAGTERIFIDSSLNIKSCLLVPKNLNFNNSSIMESINYFNDFKTNLVKKPDNKCRNCIKKALCRYCPGRFFLETGDYEKAPAFYCELADEIITELSKIEIKKYDNNIDVSILKEMYNILIQNLFIIYPEKMVNKAETDNEENFNRWVNSIKQSSNYKIITYNNHNILYGFLSYTIVDNHLWISEIQINPDYQGKDVLKNLLKEFYISIKDLGFDIIYAQINSKNLKSQSVFTHIGFQLKESTIYTITTKKLYDWINK